jgi:hypothetical protein
MTGPIIDHLDDFEAAIVAIAMRRRDEEAWMDWVEERASRTGSA